MAMLVCLCIYMVILKGDIGVGRCVKMRDGFSQSRTSLCCCSTSGGELNGRCVVIVDLYC